MSGGARLLNSDEIAEFLGELLERLAARGVEVEAYIIGGAAMALHLGREQLTPDVDGVFKPQAEVFAEAALMAEQYNLSSDWVNSRAFAFMAFDPADDKEAVQVELRGHAVTIASKRVLLAMKIAASRQKDRSDINRLIADLGITDPNEIVDLAFAVFGENNMTISDSRDEVRLIAQEALARAAKSSHAIGAHEHHRDVQVGAPTSPPYHQPRREAGQPGAGEYAVKPQSPPEIELRPVGDPPQK